MRHLSAGWPTFPDRQPADRRHALDMRILRRTANASSNRSPMGCLVSCQLCSATRYSQVMILPCFVCVSHIASSKSLGFGWLSNMSVVVTASTFGTRAPQARKLVTDPLVHSGRTVERTPYSLLLHVACTVRSPGVLYSSRDAPACDGSRVIVTMKSSIFLNATEQRPSIAPPKSTPAFPVYIRCITSIKKEYEDDMQNCSSNVAGENASHDGAHACYFSCS